jgi:hypothetical protein
VSRYTGPLWVSVSSSMILLEAHLPPLNQQRGPSDSLRALDPLARTSVRNIQFS